MAKTKIEVELLIRGEDNVSDAEKKLGSLKTQVKQLKELLSSGSLTAKQFEKASKRAGELQDRIGDVNQSVKNLASDSQKLDALLSATQGLVGGFSAVQGITAMLGEDNEELQATMVKLQGAMSALAGVQALANTLNKDSALSTTLLGKANIFNTVQTGIATTAQTIYATAVGTSTGAMKAFRIALLATGVGAVIVGIIALASAMSNMSDDTEEATEKLKAQNEERQKAIDLAREEADALDKNRKVRSGGANDLKRELDLLIAKGASEKEIYEASRKLKQKEKDDINARIGYLSDDKDAQIKLGQELKDKENEIDVLRLSFEKKQQDERKKNQEKNRADALKRKEAESKEMSDFLLSLEEQRDAEIRMDEWQKKQEETAMTDLMAQLEAENQAVQDSADKQLEIEKKLNEEKLANQKATEEARLSIINDSYMIVNQLGELALGQQFKNTAVGKGLALAQIATDTALSISALTKNSQANPANAVTGGLAGVAQYVSGILQITSSIAKAKSILMGGGSVGGGASAPSSMGGNTSSQPPRIETFQSNQTPTNPNQRVYVLEKDITDSQGRVARIRHNATLI